jgi:HAMP domain-containing protein
VQIQVPHGVGSTESLIDHLESKINNHKTAEQDPQTRISELETELLSFKEQQSVAEEGVKIDEEPESEKGAEENQQAEAASNELAEEKRVVEMELDIQVKENRRLTRMTMDNEQQINALQVEIERLSKLSEDRESLLEKSQADQETISRALLQNKQLKEQLEELQEAFVKMSTSSADLSAKLETEQYGGKDVAEKLEANVIEMEELKQQVNVSISEKTETEEQLTLARHDCEALQQKVISKEMDLDIAATELQKTKTELNRQIQLYTDLQQLKETLCFQLHGELESAQEAINKLSTENLALVQQLAQTPMIKAVEGEHVLSNDQESKQGNSQVEVIAAALNNEQGEKVEGVAEEKVKEMVKHVIDLYETVKEENEQVSTELHEEEIKPSDDQVQLC